VCQFFLLGAVVQLVYLFLINVVHAVYKSNIFKTIKSPEKCMKCEM